jgi:SHS family lactate transporter-like MFS transporter
MLTNQFGFSPNSVTVTQVVANLGAILGGITIGYTSSLLGRRLSIICICIIGGAPMYPYTFASSHVVIAAAFFEQSCVQGAWGVVSIYFMELSPDEFRAFVVGELPAWELGPLGKLDY